MWCPKCKTEYRSGIAVCAECGSPLVEELPVEVDSGAALQKAEAYGRMESRENMRVLSGGNHAYVEKSVRYEDERSTAFSFLLVGIGGFILLALIYAGVIPLQFASYMKYISGAVMGGLFAAFIIIGIRSWMKLKKIRLEAEVEKERRAAADAWFLNAYTAQALDEKAGVGDKEAAEQNYFLRSSFMKQALQEQFPDFDEPFLDYLAEQYYDALYPEE